MLFKVSDYRKLSSPITFTKDGSSLRFHHRVNVFVLTEAWQPPPGADKDTQEKDSWQKDAACNCLLDSSVLFPMFPQLIHHLVLLPPVSVKCQPITHHFSSLKASPQVDSSALGLAAQQTCVWGEEGVGRAEKGTESCLPMGTYWTFA